MLKILSAQQIKALDNYTIQHEPITSINLMERACIAFVNWFALKFTVAKKIGIVCGTGNNGGDGLVIARLLIALDYEIKVWIVRGAVQETSDFKINLKRLSNKITIGEIDISNENIFSGYDILIDAIFGAGLSRPLEGVYAKAVAIMNESEAIRIAVDIPTGLMADVPSKGIICCAHYTISFQLPKLAFMLPENNKYIGEWQIVDIGLNKTFIEREVSNFYFLERADIVSAKKLRSKFDHKGNYGRALIISGSYGKIGAAILAAKAAMRSGVGLLTTHVPKCGYTSLHTAIPESMVSIDENEKFFTQELSIENYDAIGIGPGLGTGKETIKAFTKILEQASSPMVIDADGLNILSANRELLNLIPKNSLLTPHLKEFERLTGCQCKNDFDRLELLKQFSIQTQTIVILKGAHTAIAIPNGIILFNSTGNPGMATGGSGDVLTGILTSLLAQQYSPVDAAKLGVYIHGAAGDIGAEEKGMDALIASDIISNLSKAFKNLDPDHYF